MKHMMWQRQTRLPNYAQYGLSPGMQIARQLSQAAQAQPVANWGTVGAQLMSGFLQGRDVRQQQTADDALRQAMAAWQWG